MRNFSDPTLVPDPFETGTCDSCGSFDVLLTVGHRTDPFHDSAVIERMEGQLAEPDYVAGLPICTKE
jgi:hypothetical protein